MLEVRSIDEAGTALGDVEPVEQIGRRLPSGIGCLAVGDGLAQLRIAAIRVELPHGLELLVAILRHGERIGRGNPAGVERLKAGDFGLQAHLVSAAGEITKRTFIDGRLRRCGRPLRCWRRGNDGGCDRRRLGDRLRCRGRCRRLRCCGIRLAPARCWRRRGCDRLDLVGHQLRIEFGIAGRSIGRLDAPHHHQLRRRLAGGPKAELFLQSGTIF
uniref:CelE2 n=1 Tax=Rhizobium leguminosarum TaxID=384 RepID=Q4VK24_RHILE|nr:CelE2 [Rhizobium leguminosarum]